MYQPSQALYYIFITFLFLLPKSLEAQIIFWSEPGPILKSRNIETGEENIIYTYPTQDPNNHIRQITLDENNQRVFFQLHIINPQPQQDLLMVVDYSGENLTQIEDFFSSTSLAYLNNEIIYSISSGSTSELGIRRYNLLTNQDELIYNCQPCSDVKIDRQSGRVFFQSSKVNSINLNGTGLTELSFLPDPVFGIGILGYNINSVLNDIYWTEGIPLVFPAMLTRAQFDGTLRDTIFQPGDNTGTNTIYSILTPEIDEENFKLYYFWGERTIFEQEFNYSFRRSDIDGENVEILEDFEYDSWKITSGNIDNSPQLSVTHYHYIDDHPLYNSYKYLADAVTSPSEFQEFKICTDGSSSSVFQIKYISGTSIGQGDFILQIREDAEGNNPDEYGNFSSLPPTNNDHINISYTHPKYIVSGSIGDYIHLELVETETGEVIETIPISLYNPPVLLIHGLNSNGTIFNELRTFLNYPDEFIVQPDYEKNNDKAFEVNSTLLQTNIDNVISELLFNGYAVGRVDIVGHSMGGILTRLYLQAEYYLDDINKLITLNTPHFGSEMADLAYIIDIACELFSNNHVANNEFDCFGGAIENLRTNSTSIVNDLNGNNLNLHTVPSHAIATTVTPSATSRGEVILVELILGYGVFGGDRHDMIVSETSQKGGLDQAHTSQYENPHWGPYNNPEIKQKIRDLLFANPESDVFTQDGFTSTPLNPQVNSVPVTNQVPLDISSSFENQTIDYGTEIDILVSSNSVSDSIILLYNGIGLLASNDTTETFNFGNVDIQRGIEPSNLGIVPITAYSFNRNDNTWGRDTFLVDVTTDETPLSFSQGIGILTVGQRTQLPISANFQQYSVSISAAPSVIYNFKNGLAEYQGDGYTLPIQAGIDTLTITLNGVTSPEYRIYIDEGISTSTSRPLQEELNSFELILSPNPATNSISIVTEANKAMKYYVRITNSSGISVYSSYDFEIIPNSSNSIPLEHLPDGVYFITLYNQLGSSTAKFIKQ